MAPALKTLFAIAATVAAQSKPSLDDYKKGKQDEKDAAAAKAARDKKLAAVNKVVKMLEDLQTQVLAEGEKEAASYEKFACFCKDTTAEKTEAIQKGTDEQSTLATEINKQTVKRDGQDEKIEKITKEIKEAEEEMDKATKKRKAEFAVYEDNEADLSGALAGLEGAIEVLKSSKKPSLLQLQHTMEAVRTAQDMADALGLTTAQVKRSFTSFLQQDPAVPMENYKFHSEGVIGTLEKLQGDFRKEKQDLEAAEVKSVAEHDAFMQGKTDYVKAKNADLEDTKKAKSETIEEIASASEELTTVSADLLDDKQYLAETAVMCQNTAKTYDVRSSVRQDELQALTLATEVVKGTVVKQTSAATVRFVQMGVRVKMVEQMVQNEAAMSAVEAEAEDAEKPVNFLQRAIRRHLAPIGEGAYQSGEAVMERTTDKRTKCEDGKWNDCYKSQGDYIDSHPSDREAGAKDAVVNMLRTQGAKLKSTLLVSLASQLSADPFAKIKKLIQELIERLLTEAANEANQKGWCDKAQADAKQKRDYAAEEIERLNGEMAELEALRNKLAEETSVLQNEIQDLKDKRDEATKMRQDEKEENKATVEEAQIGLEAINMAIDILDKFYKKAAKSKVDLDLMQGPADDAPGAGFDIGEAYTGAGGESGGIIGMMDVIKSDFERTIKVTTEAEAKAEADYQNFMTESGKSLAEKEVANAEKTKQHDDAVEKLESADNDLTAESLILNGAIKELLELKPTCIDTGMSYEERVARREDEIESLKKALCILSAYAEFGPEGLADAC